MLDLQNMINMAFGSIIGLIGFLLGVIYGNLKGQIKELKDAHEKLDDKVDDVREKYLTRDDLKDIFAKFDEVIKEIHACKLDHNKRKTDE